MIVTERHFEDGTCISRLDEYSGQEEGLRSADITIDPSSDNILVADTANSLILAFASLSPISIVAFSSEEGRDIS
jgi:hypothetical protein